VRWLPIAVALAACGGDDGGPKPDAPGKPGSFTLSGMVQYEDRAPIANPPGLMPPAPKPVRGAQLAVVIEKTGMMTNMVNTGADGSYAITFDGVNGEPIHLVVIAQSDDPMHPIQVRHENESSGAIQELHAFGGDTFPTETTTHDVLVTEVSGEAEAFNILDELETSMDRMHAEFGAATVTPMLTALWQKGNTDGTYYIDGNHEIHLLGASDDDDGYDDTVMLHESGHYIEDVIGRSDSPGGSHDGGPTDPRLAWSEGWATYWSLVANNGSIYTDTNASGGFSFDGDTDVTKANAGGTLGQNVSEDMVTEILWDMSDAGASDDDPLAGTFTPVAVLDQYLKTAALRANGGVTGADLVDVLDGWFIMNGLTSCTAMKKIVNTDHAFPYDYGGTAGPCP
jgi:hypothetical protein